MREGIEEREARRHEARRSRNAWYTVAFYMRQLLRASCLRELSRFRDPATGAFQDEV